MSSVDKNIAPVITKPQIQESKDISVSASATKPSNTETEEESRLALLHKEAHKLTTEELIERV
ncbi:hypothetical protein K502DRAFT_353407, partial [Neoconidiobolus thromboides FSU 785]